jgi:hypothetical protein
MRGKLGQSGGVVASHETFRYTQECEKHRVPIVIESPTVFYCPICHKDKRYLLLADITRQNNWLIRFIIFMIQLLAELLVYPFDQLGHLYIWLLGKYDTWRVKYCQVHRKERLWLGFRRGSLFPPVLIYALILKVRGN